MKFCVIGSGSRGNLTYIETWTTRVLIDAGISMSDASKRTKNKGIDITTVDAIFITHKHADHIKYIAKYAKTTNATIYIAKVAFDMLDQQVRLMLEGHKIKYIEGNTRYVHNDFEILTLQLLHDVDCLGFVFMAEGKVLTYITDTGYLPDQYIPLLKISNAIIIEANHDIEMLQNSGRPHYLIKRILSEKGHMSNTICRQILLSVLSKVQKYIIFAHLSEECNSEEIVTQEIIEAIKQKISATLLIAKQHAATDIMEL